ncbi:MAG: hypothetical protein ACE5EB_02775 [Thermodesulfobacteriota bacterium]
MGISAFFKKLISQDDFVQVHELDTPWRATAVYLYPVPVTYIYAYPFPW